MEHGTNSYDPLRSTFAEDPDLGDLVHEFVQGMPERANEVAMAWDSGDLCRLQTLSHQLRGAAPGYGFGPIGEAAGRLDDALRGGAAACAATEELVRVLLSLCEKVAA